MERAKTVWELEGAIFSIALMQTRSGDFAVQHGNQLKTGLTYAQAAEELGECILHDLAGGGYINNEGK